MTSAPGAADPGVSAPGPGPGPNRGGGPTDPPGGRSTPSEGEATSDLAPLLLAHYDVHRRELPWRQDTDPYRVWVSEVMLQQTRVETVVPYYRRWLARFPDVTRLADAPADDVLKQWEGLGYYSRARNLQRAARIVRERHAGELPSDPEALRALPGFGEYTVGAVASIAFGCRLPAVDGNVRRVLARLHDMATPTPGWLRATAAALVPPDRPGDFNQALMEFGATICTPRAPKCDACPAASLCLALARGTVGERPGRRRRAPVPEVELATAVVFDDGGRLLLVRYPGPGLLAGLWGFPAAERAGGEAPAAAAARAAAEAGVRVLPAGAVELGAVRHQFSHFTASYVAVRFRLGAGAAEAVQREGGEEGASASGRRIAATTAEGGRERAGNLPPRTNGDTGRGRFDKAPPDEVAWLTPAEAAALALPVAQRKLLRMAVGSGAPERAPGAPAEPPP